MLLRLFLHRICRKKSRKKRRFKSSIKLDSNRVLQDTRDCSILAIASKYTLKTLKQSIEVIKIVAKTSKTNIISIVSKLNNSAK